jgi:hypothetical protein
VVRRVRNLAPGATARAHRSRSSNRVGGDFAAAPSHTTGRALLHPAVRQGIA